MWVFWGTSGFKIFAEGCFAACGRRVTFPAMGKSPKDRRGTAQDERSALIFALPPAPHYRGRVPVRSCNISGAQNLSGFPRFLPGHWALGLQKLPPVRFHFRAWVCRANAPGAYTVGPVWDRPLRKTKPVPFPPSIRAALEPHQLKRRASNQEEKHPKAAGNSAAAVIEREPVS